MKKALSIAILFAMLPTIAFAQSGASLWKKVGNFLIPVQSNVGLKLPTLGGTGNPCLIIADTAGRVATATCAGGGGGSWGSITGTLSNQTDLQNALNAKLDLSAWYSTTTNQITEGANHLYYTDERVDDRVAALILNGTGLTWTYNDGANTLTGNVSLASFTTSNLAEGTNLYWTTARGTTTVSALIAATTTSALAEGINLYFTSARATTSVSALIAGTTTTALAEGNNLYFTTARATTSILAILSGTTSLPNLATLAGLVSYGSSTATTTALGDLVVTRILKLGSATTTGVNGINLSGGCFAINNVCVTGAGSGITTLGPTGQGQTGPTIVLATSSTAFNGLTASTTIVGSGNTITFTNSLAGLLTAAGGGTGISNPTAAGIVLGSYAGGAYQQLATSSLGLLTTNVAEGSNLYWTDTRFDTRLSATTSLKNLSTLSGLVIFGSSTASTTALGDLLITRTLQLGSGTTTGVIGINITGGCYAMNGVCIGVGGSTSWGSISGTLSSQTDLQNALNAKIDISTTSLPLLWQLTGLGIIGSSTATTTMQGNLLVQGNASTSALQVTNSLTAGNGNFAVNAAGAITRLGGSTAVSLSNPFLQLSSSGGDVWVQNNVASANSGVAIKAGSLANNAGSAVKFEAGGVERMRVTGDGNIGIGTTSPYAKLSVMSTLGTSSPFLVFASSTNGAATTSYLTIDAYGAATFGSATTTHGNGVNITSGCFSVAGTCITTGGSGITSVGPTGQTQTGPSIIFATSSSAYQGLTASTTITGSANTITFTNSMAGTLAAGGGGTGISNPSAAGILLGSYAGGSWQQLSTSTLGLSTTNVAEGSNLYYTSARATTSVSTLIAGTTTTALAEGNNLYWTSARATTSIVAILSATTSLPNLGNLAGLVTFGSSTATTTALGDLVVTRILKLGTGTTTGINGINITGGCFSVNNNCITGGAGSSAVGGDKAIQFASGAAFSGDNTTFAYDSTSKSVVVGTSTPFARISVQGIYGSTGKLLSIATTTNSNGSATSSVFDVNYDGTVTVNANTASGVNTLYIQNNTGDATISVRSNAGYGAGFINLFSTAPEYNAIASYISDNLKWRIGRAGGNDGIYFFVVDGLTQTLQLRDNLVAYFTGKIGVRNSTPQHHLDVKGRIGGQPGYDCQILFMSQSNVTADQLGSATVGSFACEGNMFVDVNTANAGILAYTTANSEAMASGTPPLQFLDASIATPAANNLVFLKAPLAGSATSSLGDGIAIEATIRTPKVSTATTSVAYIPLGFSDAGVGSLTTMASYSNPSNGCLLTASSTPNWKLVCFKAGVATMADTGFATSTNAFKALLIVDQTGAAVYFNRSTTAGATIASANLPVVWLRPTVGVGLSNGTAVAQAQMGIGNLKVWVADKY